MSSHLMSCHVMSWCGVGCMYTHIYIYICMYVYIHTCIKFLPMLYQQFYHLLYQCIPIQPTTGVMPLLLCINHKQPSVIGNLPWGTYMYMYIYIYTHNWVASTKSIDWLFDNYSQNYWFISSTTELSSYLYLFSLKWPMPWRRTWALRSGLWSLASSTTGLLWGRDSVQGFQQMAGIQQMINIYIYICIYVYMYIYNIHICTHMLQYIMLY